MGALAASRRAYTGPIGQTKQEGSYSINARYHAPPPNDACAARQELTLPAVGSPLLVKGTTFGAEDDATSTVVGCQDAGKKHADVFYALQMPADVLPGEKVRVLAKGTNFTPVVYARALDCAAGGADAACSSVGAGGEIVVPAVAGGAYLLVVDGYSRSADSPAVFTGDFTLEVQRVPAVDATQCAKAPDLSALGTSGTLDASYGSTSSIEGSSFGCNMFSGGGPEAFFAVTIPAKQKLDVTVTAKAAETDVQLYLLDACPGGSVTPVCKQFKAQGFGKTETMTVTNGTSAPIPYVLVVDEHLARGTQATGGDFTLSWTIAP